MAAKSATKPTSKTSTPKAAAKAAASPASASKGKKRVRVVEGEEEEDTAAVEAADTPKTKASKKSGSGVEKKDLRDKAKDLSSIEKISSKDAPKPTKGALKKSAAKPVEEEEEISLEDDAEEEEEIDFLKGFEESGDEGEDSSDEEAEGEEEAAFKVEQLPKVKGGKDEAAAVQKKLEAKAERRRNAKSGTIYLGRIPHGFHEDEMRSYFSQFGEITRLRLSRNKTTGASKHYAFIEFAYASVAQIVHETMDNYLLSGHILVCKVVPDDQIHPKMWIGANRKFRPVPKGRADAVKRSAPKTDEQKAAISKRLLKKEESKRKQLAALGIEYEFSGYAQKEVAAPVKAVAAKETPVKAGKGAKKEKASSAKKPAKSEEPAKKKARKSM